MSGNNTENFVETSTMAFSNSSEPTHQFPKDMLGFTAACAFIIAIFGTFGNLLTIFALPMCRKLRTTATAFVINLAVVELFFCVFILPISGAQYAYLQLYAEPLIFGSGCVFFAVARYTFTQAELQTIVAIALTRAIAVGFPRLYRVVDNAWFTGIYIFLIWLYSFLIKLPTGLGVFGSYTFNNYTMECDMAPAPYERFIMIVVEVIVPVLVILILYIFIFVMVKLSSMRVARSSVKSTKSSVTEDASTSENSSRKSSLTSYKHLKRMVSDSSLKARFSRRSSSTCITTSRRDMRVARTIFIIFMMVIICSFPVGFIHAIDSQGKQPRRFLAVHILYWLQYCLNLVVYVFMNRQYRAAYVQLLAQILPSCERHQTFLFPWENPSVSSRPVQGQNTSFKSRKDSTGQVLPPTPNEYKPVDPSLQQQKGRLSAILEVNSSSGISPDDVFVDNLNPTVKLDKSDLSDNKMKQNDKPNLTSFKAHGEVGTSDEKQHWISQNGETTAHSPDEENQV